MLLQVLAHHRAAAVTLRVSRSGERGEGKGQVRKGEGREKGKGERKRRKRESEGREKGKGGERGGEG